MQYIEKSDILFIINPKAGTSKIDSIINLLIENDLQYFLTNNLLELDKLMSKEISNFKVFVAVGGDGTVNSLSKYLINQNQKALAVLPTGSGNGFAFELGFDIKLENLLKQILTGKLIEIDVLTINDKSFINVAGIGLDADVALRFQKTKRGFLNYIISTFISYIKFKPFKATIYINGIEITDTFKMISIANTRQFGNNAFISPNSKPYDGKYEIVTIKSIPLIQSIPFIYRLFKGNLVNSKYVNFITCHQKIIIKADCYKYHFDGDPLLSDGVYKVDINKMCLKVVKTAYDK